MNRAILAGAALLAGIALAMPLAWSADDPSQSGPGQPGMPGMGMRPMMGAGPEGAGGPNGMGPHRMMHEMMMQRMRHLEPRQRCEERLARRAGMIAYTVAKLNLTAEQKPLWDKLNGLLQAGADRERQLCAGLKPREQRDQETILDRVSRREQFLSARLQGLHDAQPALQQLYQVLTPAQQAIVNHPFRQG